MSSVRCAVLVDSVVSVTVVSCDEDHIALCLSCLNDLLDACVNGCNRLADSLVDTSVADHVAVSEVEDDEVVLACVDGLYELLGNLRCAHLWLEVVCGNLWRVYKDTVLVLEESLSATVEEECYVSILLGLSDTELVLASL